MIAAHAWHELGDDERALAELRSLRAEPTLHRQASTSAGCSSARRVSSEVRSTSARASATWHGNSIEQALAQWEDADPVLDPIVGAVKVRLAELTARG